MTGSSSTPTSPSEECLLCSAERITPWHFEDGECWIADCMVCATPMVVWRTHGLPEDDDVEGRLLGALERVAAARYGAEGFWIDTERRRIPEHWHAHARPAGAFFDPASELAKRWTAEDTEELQRRRPEARFPDR
ncbi:MAG: hypothetical protein ACJ758_01130 [Actinomycetota bacterium]